MAEIVANMEETPREEVLLATYRDWSLLQRPGLWGFVGSMARRIESRREGQLCRSVVDAHRTANTSAGWAAEGREPVGALVGISIRPHLRSSQRSNEPSASPVDPL